MAVQLLTRPLLCGLCPVRRTLGHIRVFTDRSDAVVMVSVGRRQWRPKQAQPAMWQPVVDGAPLRLRCTARHQWSRTRAELLDAYRVADERGLRDITLGAEFFAV